MNRYAIKYFFNFWFLFLLILALFLTPSFYSNIPLLFAIGPSLLNLNTIFLSILIEALPFVLIGVLIAGFIQIFITEDHIQKWIPKNKLMAVFMSCIVGALFPACECGIVPIVRRLISKGVPIHAAMGFMLTGPLINPIVIISTYMAFGNDAKIAGLRMILGFLFAIIIALIISFSFKGTQFKQGIHINKPHAHAEKLPFNKKCSHMLTHSIDEFFDMGKYLIIGAFLAAFVQTFLSTKTLVNIGSDLPSSIFVMMALAYILSLCSEADAFIGASFSSIFPSPAILAFLIFGPMIDFKNTIMMLGVFRIKFVLWLLFIVIAVVFTLLWLAAPYI
ncbi:permease [Lysinibacillus sp. NPDC047702]|uniref:permease n=1 Tax=unclassified Lysinibacillus TaxID=2636778 RepID=UPI003D0490A2